MRSRPWRSRTAEPSCRWRSRRTSSARAVAASRGYPGSYETDLPIEGLADVSSMDGVRVFHSGTAERDGRVVTAGGRVLTVSALGTSVEAARERAYAACSLIRFDGMHHR